MTFAASLSAGHFFFLLQSFWLNSSKSDYVSAPEQDWLYKRTITDIEAVFARNVTSRTRRKSDLAEERFSEVRKVLVVVSFVVSTVLYRADLTLILLTWTIWRAATNASKWRMGFNSAFKGLILSNVLFNVNFPFCAGFQNNTCIRQCKYFCSIVTA